jgi:hypothetical protein
LQRSFVDCIKCFAHLFLVFNKTNDLSQHEQFVNSFLEFREKPFAEATPEEIKTVWFYYKELLPCVNRKWRRNSTKTTDLCSTVITRSDEGLVLWMLAEWIPIWLVEWADDKSESPSLKEKKKRIGRLFMCPTGQEKFKEFNLKVKEVRKKDSFKTWDEAFQTHCKESGGDTKRKGSSSKDDDEEAQAKKIRILKRLDDLIDI